MFVTMKYGLGKEVVVPISADTRVQLSEDSVQEALLHLLDAAGPEDAQRVPELREVVADPRSVVEVALPDGLFPVPAQSPFEPLMKGLQRLEIMVTRPHAGG